MPHNPKHDALRFAVTDHVWDRLKSEGALRHIPDEFWEWWDEKVERPLLALICEVDGHEPSPDQCGIPDHDHCAICMVPMPGQAPR